MLRSKPVKGAPPYYRDHSNRMIEEKVICAKLHLEQCLALLERGAVGDARGHIYSAQQITMDLTIEFSEFLGAHMQRYEDHQKKQEAVAKREKKK